MKVDSISLLMYVEILQEEYGIKRNTSDYKNMADFDRVYNARKD
jgi:acyl carrier protein